MINPSEPNAIYKPSPRPTLSSQSPLRSLYKTTNPLTLPIKQSKYSQTPTIQSLNPIPMYRIHHRRLYGDLTPPPDYTSEDRFHHSGAEDSDGDSAISSPHANNYHPQCEMNRGRPYPGDMYSGYVYASSLPSTRYTPYILGWYPEKN